jgi:hypothetical protein
VSFQVDSSECHLLITILLQNGGFLCDEVQFIHMFVFRPLADAVTVGCMQRGRQIRNVRCYAAVTSGIVSSILK